MVNHFERAMLTDEQWEKLKETNRIILIEPHENLAKWRQIQAKWIIDVSEEVKEWLSLYLIGEYKVCTLEVSPDDIYGGRELLSRSNRLRMICGDNNPLTKLRRFAYVFEYTTDLIYFKMRWYNGS